MWILSTISQEHNKVLRIYDGNTDGNAEARNYFTSTQQSGIVEWWWSTSVSGSNAIAYHYHEGILGTYAGGVTMQDSNFWDMQGNIVQSYSPNQWYHHKIIFDTVTDTYDWYIDGVLRVDNGTFLNPVSNIGSTNIKGGWAVTGSCYVDAIGYSWDSDYNDGDNYKEGMLVSFVLGFIPVWLGCSLDGQSNKTILGNTTIPMPNDGAHTIQIFGNNSLGTKYNSDMRHFTVITEAPDVTIQSPEYSEIFGSNAPSYVISITGLYDKIWYTIDNGIINITTNELSGTISQTEWEKKEDGIVSIIFYANNSQGLIGSAEVEIVKYLSVDGDGNGTIPGFNVIMILGIIIVISVFLTKKLPKKRI